MNCSKHGFSSPKLRGVSHTKTWNAFTLSSKFSSLALMNANPKGSELIFQEREKDCNWSNLSMRWSKWSEKVGGIRTEDPHTPLPCPLFPPHLHNRKPAFHWPHVLPPQLSRLCGGGLSPMTNMHVWSCLFSVLLPCYELFQKKICNFSLLMFICMKNLTVTIQQKKKGKRDRQLLLEVVKIKTGPSGISDQGKWLRQCGRRTLKRRRWEWDHKVTRSIKPTSLIQVTEIQL